MHQPMEGVRVLEVAQFTFVPAAAAILSDWGAEVIKVEHAVKGDAQRGLVSVLGLDAVTPGSSFYPIMEGPNRGKRSIGLTLDRPAVRPVLEALIRQSDVFLTNYLPGARRKLGIDVEDVREVNPKIIYVRGSGYGARGEEADKGGYDSTAFWARAGSAAHVTPPDSERMCHMPTGAYGDSLGGMAIAGGISAALYRRATTGETSIVDVSLLGVGAWAMQFGVNLAMMTGGPLPEAGSPQHGAAKNPLSGTYKTSDGRWVMLTMLQPGRFWAEFVTLIGRQDLVADPRFDTTDKLMANAPAAGQIVAEVLRTRTYKEWTALFATMSGPWAPVQDAWEVSQDKMLRANGFIAKLIDSDGAERELVTSPVQFDEVPQQLTRAPQFAEHTDEIIKELGISDEEAIQLKISGAVT